MPPRLPAAHPAGGPRARTPRARWRPAPPLAPTCHCRRGHTAPRALWHPSPPPAPAPAPAPLPPGTCAAGRQRTRSARLEQQARWRASRQPCAWLCCCTRASDHQPRLSLGFKHAGVHQPIGCGPGHGCTRGASVLSGPFADHDSGQHRTGGAVPWQAARARGGGGECSRPQPLESLISVSYSQQSLVRVHDFFGSEWLEGLAGARVPQGCVVSWQAGRAVEEPQLVGPTLPKAWGSWDLKPALAFRPGDPSVRQYW